MSETDLPRDFSEQEYAVAWKSILELAKSLSPDKKLTGSMIGAHLNKLENSVKWCELKKKHPYGDLVTFIKKAGGDDVFQILQPNAAGELVPVQKPAVKAVASAKLVNSEPQTTMDLLRDMAKRIVSLENAVTSGQADMARLQAEMARLHGEVAEKKTNVWMEINTKSMRQNKQK